MLNKNRIIIAAAVFCSCILPVDKGVCGDQDIKATQGIKTTSDIKTAADEGKNTETKAVTKAINVDNVTCLVSDDDIIPAEVVKYEYNGKIYNFCCESCVNHFKKYPDKFVSKSIKR